jgi:hypothetical protein
MAQEHGIAVPCDTCGCCTRGWCGPTGGAVRIMRVVITGGSYAGVHDCRLCCPGGLTYGRHMSSCIGGQFAAMTIFPSGVTPGIANLIIGDDSGTGGFGGCAAPTRVSRWLFYYSDIGSSSIDCTPSGFFVAAPTPAFFDSFNGPQCTHPTSVTVQGILT